MITFEPKRLRRGGHPDFARPAVVAHRPIGGSAPTRSHEHGRLPVHQPASDTPRLALISQGDAHEREARQISERVMHMSDAKREPDCHCGGSCHECRAHATDLTIPSTRSWREEEGQAGATTAARSVASTLHSSGMPLDAPSREFFERRFGHDFGSVRVHADTEAAKSARAINALAYTLGQHVVFGRGQYSPDTARGRRLLAHEMAHVVQQSAAADVALTPDRGEVVLPVARAVTEGQEASEGSPEPSAEEDTCAGYERDPQSMSWSVLKEVVEKHLHKPWPMLGDMRCHTGRIIDCEGTLATGETFQVDYDPSVNEGHVHLSRGDEILAACSFSYSCPETSRINVELSCLALTLE